MIKKLLLSIIVGCILSSIITAIFSPAPVWCAIIGFICGVVSASIAIWVF